MSVKGLSGMDVHTNPDRRFTSAGSFISCCPFSYNNFNKTSEEYYFSSNVNVRLVQQATFLS